MEKNKVVDDITWSPIFVILRFWLFTCYCGGCGWSARISLFLFSAHILLHLCGVRESSKMVKYHDFWMIPMMAFFCNRCLIICFFRLISLVDDHHSFCSKKSLNSKQKRTFKQYLSYFSFLSVFYYFIWKKCESNSNDLI